MRTDPTGQNFYKPLLAAERAQGVVFYITALLSFAVLLVSSVETPDLYNIIQSIFCLGVISLALLGLSIRVHWSRRAQERRIDDLLSHSYNVFLVDERPTEYYNNNEQSTDRRLLASLIENTLFTKLILAQMLFAVRTRVVLYVALWIIALMNIRSDLAWTTTAAQVIFSEQIVSYWIRTEWLRSRVEQIHDQAYAIALSNRHYFSAEVRASALALVLKYEIAKAQAGISLSTRLFKRLNPTLSAKWTDMKRILHIQSD